MSLALRRILAVRARPLVAVAARLGGVRSVMNGAIVTTQGPLVLCTLSPLKYTAHKYSSTRLALGFKVWNSNTTGCPDASRYFNMWRTRGVFAHFYFFRHIVLICIWEYSMYPVTATELPPHTHVLNLTISHQQGRARLPWCFSHTHSTPHIVSIVIGIGTHTTDKAARVYALTQAGSPANTHCL